MLYGRYKHTGFTLMELMVSVFVLLVVMVAVGRIFSTTSDVTAKGRAISETLQKCVAIEQQLRKDISKISREGFLAIRSVSIANNIKGDYLLIDPSLPLEAIIRCDQLIFFTNGIASPMLNTGTTDFAGQGLASMIYYGHGIQFPRLDGAVLVSVPGESKIWESDDPKYFESDIPGVITPWYEGAIEIETRKYADTQDNRFEFVEDDMFVSGMQPSASDWMLCKQVVVLADDDQEVASSPSKRTYLTKGVSTQSIFPWDPRIDGAQRYPHILQGRVDIAASQLDDIRQSVLQWMEGPPGSLGETQNRSWRVVGDPFVDQQELIATLFYWPRVEPYPPTEIRYDQVLMFSSLAHGCVSFQVEWTYDEGVGQATDANRTLFPGYSYRDDALWFSSRGLINRKVHSGQPWWGSSWRLDPENPSDLRIGYDTLTSWTDDVNQGVTNHIPAWSVDPTIIEPTFSPQDGHVQSLVFVPTVQNVDAGVSEYWAIFGYNGLDPFFENNLDFLNDNQFGDNGQVVDGGMDDGWFPGSSTWRYTPWPSSLRITLQLKDRDNKLGKSWTHQFVVDLPERKQ